jgi:integrase/recombinase XerD
MEINDIIFEPVIWKYDTLNNGEFPIYLRMTHYKDVKYIKTGYSGKQSDWDVFKALPFTSHPQYVSICKRIEDLTDSVKFEIRLASKNGEQLFSLAEIKNRVTKKAKVILGPPKKVLEYFDKVVNELEEAGRCGYADVIKATKDKVKQFLNEKDKPFQSFTKADHEGYEKFILKTKPSASTLSFYLRNYYRIWNLAIDAQICVKAQHPSNFIKSKPYKKIRTKKRAIKIDYFQKIINLEFPYESREFRSLQYFKFSYYSRGMNFTDLCKLKAKQFMNEDVSYKRSKNGRDYDFELHPKAIEVIKIFNDYPMQSDDGYIFPILYRIQDTPRKIDQRIESALQDVNEDLKEFGNKVGLERKVTTYSARHSFATHLSQNGVDISIIQSALGHETEEQTRTYLEDIDDSVITNAVNKALK